MQRRRVLKPFSPMDFDDSCDFLVIFAPTTQLQKTSSSCVVRAAWRFLLSHCRIRSESFAAWVLSRRAFGRDRVPVPYFLPQECSEAWLMPCSADAEFSERSLLFSYRATASRLNSSEYLNMVVDYLSCRTKRAGYQVSTKQGSGPNVEKQLPHSVPSVEAA